MGQSAGVSKGELHKSDDAPPCPPHSPAHATGVGSHQPCCPSRKSQRSGCDGQEARCRRMQLNSRQT